MHSRLIYTKYIITLIIIYLVIHSAFYHFLPEATAKPMSRRTVWPTGRTSGRAINLPARRPCVIQYLYRKHIVLSIFFHENDL